MTPFFAMLALLSIVVVYVLVRASRKSPKPNPTSLKQMMEAQAQAPHPPVTPAYKQAELQKLWDDLANAKTESIDEPDTITAPADDFCPECGKAFACTDDYICGECRAKVG